MRIGRAAVGRLAACLLACPPPWPAIASDGALPRITSKVSLSLTIGQGEPQRLVIGLYGEEAPASVNLFRSLCSGTVTKYPGLSYRSSTVPKVQKDTIIVLGRISGGAAQQIDRSIDSTGCAHAF